MMSTSFKNRPFAGLSKAGQGVVWQVFLQPGKHKAVLFKRSDAAMMNAMGSPMNSAQLSAFLEGVLAMGDAVAKLGWFLGAMLILLMLAAWKKVEESRRKFSESFRVIC